MTRVVILMQENKTPDFYFPTLAAWGADVRNGGNLLTVPPGFDQAHDRNAWVHYKMGDYPAVDLQIDNDTVIPFYSWLAKQFTFCDHHFGLGTNSTPGHMLAVGGQTPTMRNPPSQIAVWDLPTIFKHVERGGHSWAAFPNKKYPVQHYAELSDAASQANIYPPHTFIEMATTGALPDFCFVWSPDGYDEHPPMSKHDPLYIQKGHDLVWQRVDAVVQGGGWADTVFILTWDDWGGYTDHVDTPNAETVPDALHPDGFQAIGGSRIPLIMFGGQVKQGIESSWHSHASLLKTVIDLFGLPPFGVPRVDSAPSLADRVDLALSRPQPPAFGSQIVQPDPPSPTPGPVPPAPWTGPQAQPMPDLVTNDGSLVPAPTDGLVRPNPPLRDITKVPPGVPSGPITPPITIPSVMHDILAGIHTEQPFGRDRLDIKRDVNALCSIIASKGLQPPLSIGLLGDWGSGKSFFMQKMRERIESLKTHPNQSDNDFPYCRHIVQLEFNAWHYIDTNLWASLGAEIFEQLDQAVASYQEKVASGTGDGPEAASWRLKQAQQLREQERGELKSQLAEGLREKAQAEARLRERDQDLSQLEEERRRVADLTVKISTPDAIRGIYEVIRDDDETRRKVEEAVVRGLHLEQNSPQAEKVTADLAQLEGLAQQAKALWLSIQNTQDRTFGLKVIGGLLGALGVACLVWLLASHVGAFWGSVTSVLGLLIALLAALSPFAAQAGRLVAGVNSAIKNSQQSAKDKKQAELETLKQKAQETGESVVEAKRQVEQFKARIDDIQKKLDDLYADRRLSKFVRDRHQSSDYTKYLGVIARMRNDLEYLSVLLAGVRDQEREERDERDEQLVSKDDAVGAATAAEGQRASDLIASIPRVDRIVLYIDDLDRCPEDKVVDVLQAVHLLLAFPLFVVVVGVDSRWLVHSLQQHITVFQMSERPDIAMSDEDRLHWQATPLSYLEKIFQVPFALRPMQQTGFDNLVDDLTQPQMESDGTPAKQVNGEVPASRPSAEPARDGTTQGAEEVGPAVDNEGRESGEPTTPTTLQSATPSQSQNLTADTTVSLPNESRREAQDREEHEEDVLDPDPRPLKLEEWERTFMKRLYPLISSPRAANRLVNMYRILRVSLSSTEVTEFVGTEQGGAYQEVQLLLAMMIGYPAETARILADLLAEKKPDEAWRTFRERYKDLAKVGAVATQSSDADISDRDYPERWSALLGTLAELDQLFPKNTLCRQFVKWAPEVARFSFRSARIAQQRS